MKSNNIILTEKTEMEKKEDYVRDFIFKITELTTYFRELDKGK